MLLFFVGVIGILLSLVTIVQSTRSGVNQTVSAKEKGVSADANVSTSVKKVMMDIVERAQKLPGMGSTTSTSGEKGTSVGTQQTISGKGTGGGAQTPSGPVYIAGENTSAYPGAPLCTRHDNNVYHGLWNEQDRCHYDHEHGQNPLASGVAGTFPGFNLLQLTGGVSIGHTNPSSAMENTHKHGGFKWQFMPTHPQGCAGFESSTNGVNGSLVQTHGFGDYTMELTGRIHSSLALLRMCNQANPTDYGYLYTVQFQDYGQIVAPYQGDVLPFPFTPPAYDPARGPYLTIDCVGQKGAGERGACRTSREQVLNGRFNANTNWSSKPTGVNARNPFGSTLYTLFFRARDTYQLLDWNDKTYPFTFRWLCSSDGGATYNPSGCRYNNSTIQVNEIAGRIPASWDNMSGFDSDNRVGRITATGFTDRYGTLNRSCTGPRVGATRADDCFPIKMVNAFVGTYGSILSGKGVSGPYLPEHDIYFCNGRVCAENAAGAVPSGWIGQSN